MSELFSRNIILHWFYVDNDEGELGSRYHIIIGQELMVQLCLAAGFKLQVLAWNYAVLKMKTLRSFLVLKNLNKHNIQKVVIHTA